MKGTIHKLTKKELIHIIESVDAMTLYKRSCAKQKQWRDEAMQKEQPSIEPCWECKFIAEKLGWPT